MEGLRERVEVLEGNLNKITELENTLSKLITTLDTFILEIREDRERTKGEVKKLQLGMMVLLISLLIVMFR